MSSSARIMLYTQDSYGLGHLRRATNIANALVARRRDLSVLLVVDSPVAPFFELSEHIDFVKLPTVVKVEAGVFRPGRLQTSYRLVRVMRANLLREITRRYRPHAVLVDHMPGGANRELMPALRMLSNGRRRTRFVLGLRDIIDRPETTCDLWRREGVYETIGRFYDTVLIYGAGDIFATARHYRLDGELCRSVRYCGYLCNMDPAKDPARIRAKTGIVGKPIVAAMAGGGWDAYDLLRTFLAALKLLGGRDRPFGAVMVTGPLMPPEQRKALRSEARALGVHIHTSVGDTVSQINAADLVVSMAGYNTLSEILRFGKRAVIIPRPGPSAEQTMRAGLFARRGLIRTLAHNAISAASLAAEIRAGLAAPAPPPPVSVLNGLEGATSALLELLPGAGARSGAPEITVTGAALPPQIPVDPVDPASGGT